ncbi:hypothetical protein PAHAL_2G245700 [Panicum hallii]|uniref:TTF-type domain-containing protein n=1 Tax=Panicum hallii TaxID=206008 RepID=A0A2T8KQ88_9POAL|nr:hypothetical protein PAHAL_2G245700 [Panicum hallii]
MHIQQKGINSFFKRKRDESNIENEQVQVQVEEPPRDADQSPLPLIEAEHHHRQEEQQPIPVLFRGIEFLERDPALRPQIWEYPSNQQNEVQRAYLKLGPMQPKLKNYKAFGPQGHQCRFQYHWFSEFPSWLEYSESSGKAYCLLCFLCSKNIKKRGGFDAFTIQGFNNWKKVHDRKNCAFLVHIGSDPCSEHNNSAKECQALLNNLNHIDNIMEVAKFNPEIAAVVLENAPQCAKYTSPDIQKEILSIFALKIRKHIREEIGDQKFSIIVDETCDISKREQMAIVLRFVDIDGVLQERFFDLVHVRNTKALTLKAEICYVLSTYGFDVQNLRGQGYDGASNMRGELNGLQALVLKECPYAYYVHCYAHRLQLALVAAAKDVVPVTQFFQKLLFIVNTVDSSAKRHDELHDAQVVELARLLAVDELETGQGANQIRSLKRPGDTRWGSHLGSISSLMDMFNPVSTVLQNLAADSTAGTNRADGDTSFNYMISFEFVFILCLMREILEITEQLGQALQKKSQDIVNAIRLVQTTKILLEKMRSDDGWETFICKVMEFCVDHDIDIPNMDETYILRGGRARRQPNHFTTDHFFRVEVFRATLDTQLAELNLKFNEKVIGLLSICVTLVPKNGFASFQSSEICKMRAFSTLKIIKTRLRNRMEDDFLANSML